MQNNLYIWPFLIFIKWVIFSSGGSTIQFSFLFLKYFIFDSPSYYTIMKMPSNPTATKQINTESSSSSSFHIFLEELLLKCNEAA